jgi:hypothetical protein
MNYKTIFMLAVIAAAFVAIGSATPVFAQNTANNDASVGNQVDDSCNGATSQARCGQIGQNNRNGDNTVEGDLNFN